MAEAAYIPTTPTPPTPVPTATPQPTATLVPTATPQPAPTAVPTATPSEPRPVYTVGTLPTCDGTSKYTRAFVSDSVACSFGVTLTGGSTQACPVFCDGAAWLGG